MQDNHDTGFRAETQGRHAPDNAEEIPTFLDDSEFPVDPRLGRATTEDVGLRFGLRPAPNDHYRLIRNAFLLSLVEARLRGGLGVHYSRCRTWYTRYRKTLPPYWTFTNVKRVVDDLIAAVNLFEHDLVKPGTPWRGKPRSSIIATNTFVDCINSDTILLATAQVVDDIIVLRDETKTSISFEETEAIAAMRRQLDRYNKAVAGAAITIAHPDAELIGQGLYRVLHDGRRLLLKTSRRVSRRVFCNTSFQQGGRLFDPFWTNCPKAYRKAIQIDGEPTEEIDFVACHLRLAYAYAGRVDELARYHNQDLYAVSSTGAKDPLPRHVYKFSTLIMLNAPSRRSALGAIKHECLKHIPSHDQKAAALALVRRIEAAHPALKRLWFTGVGTTLQFIEAEVLTSCLDQLLDRGIVGLSTHDAIRVAQQHAAITKQIMDTTLESRGFSLAASMGPCPPSLPKPLKKARNSSGRDLTIRVAKGVSSGAEIIDFPSSLPSARFAPISSRDHLPLPFAEALADLATIARAQGTITPNLAAAARALFGANRGGVDSTQRWLSSLGLGEPPVRGAKPIPPPITGVKLARRLGITAIMADGMGLNVIRPRSGSSMCRDTRRRLDALLKGTQRRIVIIEPIAPWRHERCGKARWFARFQNADDAQIAALRVAIACGMHEVLADVRSNLAVAEADRALLTEVRTLAVDALMSRVRAELPPVPKLQDTQSEAPPTDQPSTDAAQVPPPATETAEQPNEIRKPGLLSATRGWLP